MTPSVALALIHSMPRFLFDTPLGLLPFLFLYLAGIGAGQQKHKNKYKMG